MSLPVGNTSPFALSATVYSDVLIDKGNVSIEIGPGGSLNGKVGDKFLVPIGRQSGGEPSLTATWKMLVAFPMTPRLIHLFQEVCSGSRMASW